MFRKIWNLIRSPSGYFSLGTLLVAGFAAGIFFWGGLHWGIEMTNSEEFCISCHEMRETVYPEYQQSVHYKNASGVGAICSDCHVPREWLPKMLRKAKASSELYYHLAGYYPTKEDFEAHRAELAQHVWDTMKANDSLECRNCHRVNHMDFTLMSENAQKLMEAGLERGDTCIDCHKGIAHKVPDMSQGYKKLYEELVAEAEKQDGSGDALYPLETIAYYANADDAAEEAHEAGKVLAATKLKVLDKSGSAIHVEINGWQQDGVDKIIYALRGQRIFEATVKSPENIERIATETDEETDLVWHKVKMDAWVLPGRVVDDKAAINDYASALYEASCSVCHSKPAPDHLLANQWIGTLKAMERFVSINKEQKRLLQKYLQLRAKDTKDVTAHAMN
jgi:trimethylamine-N-oxide reductase (cytochrome c), cytochrome c-type subunit TorC